MREPWSLLASKLYPTGERLLLINSMTLCEKPQEPASAAWINNRVCGIMLLWKLLRDDLVGSLAAARSVDG